MTIRYYTTMEAAEMLGVTPRRVRAMIEAGQLPKDKHGRDLLIDEFALKSLIDRRKERTND